MVTVVGLHCPVRVNGNGCWTTLSCARECLTFFAAANGIYFKITREGQLHVPDELKHHFARISSEINQFSWKMEAVGPRPIVVPAA